MKWVLIVVSQTPSPTIHRGNIPSANDQSSLGRLVRPPLFLLQTRNNDNHQDPMMMPMEIIMAGILVDLFPDATRAYGPEQKGSALIGCWPLIPWRFN